MIPGILAFCAALSAGAAARAEEYAIRPGDLVDVSVLSHPELTRTYRVRLDGAITMHILGSVEAAGLSPAQLESSLEQQLSEVFEGSTSATVEVAEYRPVIVGGQVVAPGAYPFQPGLDVAGALALARGTGASTLSDDLSASMRVESETARHALLRAQLAGLLVERARLVAERDGLAEITVPDEARTTLGAAAGALAEAQEALRAARDEELTLRLAAIDATRRLAEEEAGAYSERQQLIRSQLDATQKELDGQLKLAERGLALNQRMFDLRVSEAGYRADELEAVALEAQARKTISDAEAGKQGATVLRAGEVATALAEIDADIAEIRVDMDQARRFVAVFGGQAKAAEMTGAGMVYRLRRRGPEGVTVIAASPDTLLQPGDMLEVATLEQTPDPSGGMNDR
ncbi:exopolysaccharide production protein ExoF [Cereibacter ovatus]|uniref:Exopolysaccharide production protein ExoF n=1 Tax=Cereibacter ovatus TaxID=439529 RepID=A0A285CU82_9RHOB|nr:polysaccharide biosynthesis/export family protein [Cereibacter ovatus]SNX71117.1 exopolysaccharide production protein ExoF [Cereibacter ovatus]